MIEYSVEKPDKLKVELQPLAEKHFSEDYRQEASDLSINWDIYETLDSVGSVHIITARDSGKLVGYISAITQEHQHTEGVVSGSMDALFVHPDYRSNGVASELFSKMETLLTDKGVSWFSATFREEKTAESVTGKYGYKKVECTFGKTLRKK